MTTTFILALLLSKQPGTPTSLPMPANPCSNELKCPGRYRAVPAKPPRVIYRERGQSK